MLSPIHSGISRWWEWRLLVLSWRSWECWCHQKAPGEFSTDRNALQFAHIGYRLAPIDSILTRMGAYDNIFSNVTTFKVELNEMSVSWCPQYHCIQLSFPNCLRDATSSSMILKVHFVMITKQVLILHSETIAFSGVSHSSSGKVTEPLNKEIRGTCRLVAHLDVLISVMCSIVMNVCIHK